MITYDRLFIGGSWVEPGDPELLDITSPHDRSVIGRAAQAQPADVDRAVAAARASFEAGGWRATPPAQRIAVLRRFNALREREAEKIAHLISLENGSAGWFTRAGQPGLTRQADAYLKAAEEFGWEEAWVPSGPASPVRSVVRREAIGVVAAVIPWNSPFSSAATKIIPALLAGNSVVLKVSPENSLSMGFLAELLERVGLPEGVTVFCPRTGRPVSTSCRTGRSTRSPSPARRGPAVASPRSRAGNSSASAWSWAASPPPSSCRTPTSRRRSRA
jgi:acyl-CoA reductase-like NAD-dependent aldehyde dehydrogenase